MCWSRTYMLYKMTRSNDTSVAGSELLVFLSHGTFYNRSTRLCLFLSVNLSDSVRRTKGVWRVLNDILGVGAFGGRLGTLRDFGLTEMSSCTEHIVTLVKLLLFFYWSVQHIGRHTFFINMLWKSSSLFSVKWISTVCDSHCNMHTLAFSFFAPILSRVSIRISCIE